MKRYFRTTCVFLFVLSFVSLKAQQIPTNNQYLVNKYLISPSYAGWDDRSKIFIGYKSSWNDFEGAPKTSMFNGYFPINDKVWLGAQIISDKSGVFNNIYAQFSYTYHLEVGYDQMVYFGMWANMFQNKINLTDGDLQLLNDPIFDGRNELTGFSLNAGASAVFKWRKGYVGVSVPYLFKNRDIYVSEDANNIIELNTQILGHVSYKFMLNYDVEIEPFFLYRWIQDYDSQMEFSVRVIYRENFWASALYKDIGRTGIGVGAHLGEKLTFNYTFEFVTKKYLAQPSSTHEFTLGFNLPSFGNKYSSNRWRRSLYNR